ncbi:MAG: DUF4040 domain-containing protein [Spirulina sp. DLM2.Bin59]|nr:MAG: DUF4040 domain-containing protein [Spirulina sp. DLM2.Bin59]
MNDLWNEENLYIVAIAVLLPLTAGLVIVQVNPYYALVMRGILGAVAALVYALFGAADVALTEALVGTMLSITLYAIAVRSSLIMRLGIIEPDLPPEDLLQTLRQPLRPYHLRLELVPYPDQESLQAALEGKEVHGICFSQAAVKTPAPQYEIQTRVPRLYQILSGHLPLEKMAILNPAPPLTPANSL